MPATKVWSQEGFFLASLDSLQRSVFSLQPVGRFPRSFLDNQVSQSLRSSMPSFLETLSLAIREFWKILTRQSSTTLVNGNIHKGVRKSTTTRQPPPNRTRFPWTYMLILFSCGRRQPCRGDSSFYVDGDLEAGQATSSGPQDGRNDSFCEGEFVDIDLNDGKPLQRPSQTREPSSFMPPKFYFPVPIPIEMEKDNDQQGQREGNPSPPPLVLSDILDQFPPPPTSHPRIHKNDIIRGDSSPSSNLKRFPRPLTPMIDFDASSSSFSSEFESMLSLSYDSSTSSSCFSPSSSPPATPLSPFTPWTPTTPLRAVLPAWCEYHTSNIAKREEAYRKMRLKKKKLGEREEREDVDRARDDDGSLSRLKTKRLAISGELEEGAKKQEQTIDAVHQKASHSEKDARSDTADDRESQDTLRNFKILHKSIIRLPLRVFIPGHKRSTKRGSASGSLSRMKSPAIPAELEGYGGKTQEQTINTVHQKANHSEKDARSDAAHHRSKSESQDLRNFKILPPKPIRPPLRVFIPGHKRSPPIFTLPDPDDLFIPEEDMEDAYADQSYVITQPHKPIVLRRKSTSESHVQLRRARSDAKHDMTNVLRAFNEMVLGTEEDFRTLFEGESLSTSLSLVSSVVEERNILPASLSRSRSRSWSGSGMGKIGRTRMSMASRLARAHSCAHVRTQGGRDGDGDGGEETSSDEDVFDEEKMAPEEWFDMVGLDEYLA